MISNQPNLSAGAGEAQVFWSRSKVLASSSRLALRWDGRTFKHSLPMSWIFLRILGEKWITLHRIP
jgi:hypothetical protein